MLQTGIVVLNDTAEALLASNPAPSDADIDRAMAGNICRCGAYGQIRAAIHSAAETPVTPATEAVSADKGADS